MTSLDAYYSLLEKVNRLDTNQNIQVPRGKFVQIFNEQQRNWVKRKQPREEATDESNDFVNLLVDEAQLPIKDRERDNVSAELPEDFLKMESVYVLADRGSCKNRVVVAWPTKPKSNLQLLLRDSNHQPSFDYEETLYALRDNRLKVYFDGFKITRILASYYRFPRDIDLAGYIRLDGAASRDQHPEVDNDQVDEILELCAVEVMRSSQNPEGFNLSATRLQP